MPLFGSKNPVADIVGELENAVDTETEEIQSIVDSCKSHVDALSGHLTRLEVLQTRIEMATVKANSSRAMYSNLINAINGGSP